MTRRTKPSIVCRSPLVCQLVLLAGILLVHAPCAGGDSPVVADVVFAHAVLLDGSGQAARKANLAIRGDRIVAMGDFRVAGNPRTIECEGLWLTPGFIDLHNHSDEPLTQVETRDAKNYVLQGCTTLVTGNCGAGRFPVAQYLQDLTEHGIGVNVAHLIPHGALRERVLGNFRIQPTPEQLQNMEMMVAKNMQDGAWGMSSGLAYVPGIYAETNELIALARIVAQHRGFYASHIRNEDGQLLDAVDEAIEVGRQAKLPVHISHFKVLGEPYWGAVHAAIRRIESARARGEQVTADQYPYTASGTVLSAMVLPDWVREGGMEATANRVRTTARSQELRKSIAQALEIRQKIVIARCAAFPEYSGQDLRDLARKNQMDIIDLVLQIIANGDATAINFSLNETDVRAVMRLPWVATASDGSVQASRGDMTHPRSFGTFPRKLRQYAIEEQVVPIPLAVRSCTGLPADILNLPERGYLKVGYHADLVVLDPTRLQDMATYDEPQRFATGIQYVYINGEPVLEAGRFLAVLKGRVLRKPTPRN